MYGMAFDGADAVFSISNAEDKTTYGSSSERGFVMTVITTHADTPVSFDVATGSTPYTVYADGRYYKFAALRVVY